jgi:hypothetical protein
MEQSGLPFESFDSVSCDVFTHANGLNPGLFDLLKLADFTKMWFGCIARAKLASPYDGPTTLGIVTRAGVATCSSSENGLFALS